MKKLKFDREEDAALSPQQRHLKAIAIVKEKIFAALKAPTLYTDQYSVTLTTDPENIKVAIEKTKKNKTKTAWHLIELRMYQSPHIEYFRGLIILGDHSLYLSNKAGQRLAVYSNDAIEVLQMILGTRKPNKQYLADQEIGFKLIGKKK